VCGSYQLLTSQQLVILDAAEKLIWHRQVPLKVSIFACRLLRDRLSTKTNLVTREIITPSSHFCVSGCRGVELAKHLFLSCSTFGSLWSSIQIWSGFSAVDSHHLPDQFLQIAYLAGGLRQRQEIRHYLETHSSPLLKCWTMSNCIEVQEVLKGEIQSFKPITFGNFFFMFVSSSK
jgi:hypothetical protein